MCAEECPASGQGHNFKVEMIPSEFITGVEGGEPTKVVQCEYCGEEKSVKAIVNDCVKCGTDLSLTSRVCRSCGHFNPMYKD